MSNTSSNKEPKHKVRMVKVLPKVKRAISATVEQVLEEASKGLSSDIIAWIKQQVESSIHLWIGENLGKIGISLVVDSNVIIQSMKYYAKGKTPILYKLVENPLFPLYTPKEAEAEVIDYIENKTKTIHDKKKLREAWEKLKTVLKIKEVQDHKAQRMADEIIGKRDPGDTPFIGLYIETGSVAILTNDRDYDSLSVRKFSIGELNDVVGVFHRGFFSFFIMYDMIPLVLEGLSKIVMAIAKVLYQFLKLIFDICVGIVTGAIEKVSELISKIPANAQKWIGIGLLGAAIAVMVLMIFHKGARDKISGAVKTVWNGVKSTIVTLATWLSGMIEKLIHYAELSAPYIGTSAEIFVEIHKHIIVMTEEIKDLRLEKAAYYA